MNVISTDVTELNAQVKIPVGLLEEVGFNPANTKLIAFMDDYVRSLVLHIRTVMLKAENEHKVEVQDGTVSTQTTVDEEVRYPATAWDAVKERLLPGWAKARGWVRYVTVPVRVTKVITTHVTHVHRETRLCPHVRIPDDLRHLRWVDPRAARENISYRP